MGQISSMCALAVSHETATAASPDGIGRLLSHHRGEAPGFGTSGLLGWWSKVYALTIALIVSLAFHSHGTVFHLVHECVRAKNTIVTTCRCHYSICLACRCSAEVCGAVFLTRYPLRVSYVNLCAFCLKSRVFL